MMDAKTRIAQLKKSLNAIILVHNYELAEVQDIADFCGDSLELSRKAAETQADVLVFCGVKFMAETAKILSPAKTVLLPVADAPCDMADMADAEALRQFKAKYDRPITVCYVNTTAAVKAECDMCVTSSNALEIVSMLPKNRPIIFVPDKNLGAYCAAKTGRDLILWEGFCPVHNRMTVEMAERRKREYPDSPLLVHPEAPLALLEKADEALSTGAMLQYVRKSEKKSFVIGTEVGILQRMERELPDKRFIPLSGDAVCPYMKLIQLKDVLEALEKRRHVIEVPEEIRVRAELPIRRMLAKNCNF